MENFFTRYRNVTVLLSLLMAQVIVLATQVRRTGTATGESMSLVRTWVVQIFVPGEKAITSIGSGVRNLWKDYIDLRDVRAQNEELKAQLDRLRLEQVSLAEDAGQARRLQALLGFKQKFIAQTVAAQVSRSTSTDRSRAVTIDKGSKDGIKADMPVITPKGIVGKVYKVFSRSAQVLEINDATSGAGVMLGRSRLRAVMRGTSSGIPCIMQAISGEKGEPGGTVGSSGGDQIYPPGLPVGTVQSTAPDPEGGPLMLVRVKPSANLDKVDEVLVITQVSEKEPQYLEGQRPVRAADILAQRLPTIAPKAPDKTGAEPPPTSALYAKKTPPATTEVSPGTATPKKKPVQTSPGSQSAPSSTNSSVTAPGESSTETKKTTSSAPNGTEPSASEPKKPKAPSATPPAEPRPAAPSENAQPQENPR